jgi:hypothetical protein
MHMGKKISRAGMEMRIAIKADLEANPNVDHFTLRSKHKAAEPIIESAMTKTGAE